MVLLVGLQEQLIVDVVRPRCDEKNRLHAGGEREELEGERAANTSLSRNLEVRRTSDPSDMNVAAHMTNESCTKEMKDCTCNKSRKR